MTDFRDISQLVAVEPGARYELELFYRPDLTMKSSLKWQILNAATQAPIAATQPLTLAGDWIRTAVSFSVPSDTDGIVIHLVHDGCTGGACPITGKLVFDDISLRRL